MPELPALDRRDDSFWLGLGIADTFPDPSDSDGDACFVGELRSGDKHHSEQISHGECHSQFGTNK
jgi:hypothetical protein